MGLTPDWSKHWNVGMHNNSLTEAVPHLGCSGAFHSCALPSGAFCHAIGRRHVASAPPPPPAASSSSNGLIHSLFFFDIRKVCGGGRGARWQGRREVERSGLQSPHTLSGVAHVVCVRVRPRAFHLMRMVR